MSTILELGDPDTYEPTQEEMIEYGEWLGLTLPEDNDLLHIARDGLRAPLPAGWKACRSEKGDIYYFNFSTGESQWDHPLDKTFKLKARDAMAKKLWIKKRHSVAQQVHQIAFKTSSSSSSSVGTVCREIFDVRVLVTKFLLPKWSLDAHVDEVDKLLKEKEEAKKKNEEEQEGKEIEK